MFQKSCLPAELVMPIQLGALRAAMRTSTGAVCDGDGVAGTTAAGVGEVVWCCAAVIAPSVVALALACVVPPVWLGHICTAATSPTAASAPTRAMDQLGPVRTAPLPAARNAAGR